MPDELLDKKFRVTAVKCERCEPLYGSTGWVRSEDFGTIVTAREIRDEPQHCWICRGDVLLSLEPVNA